MLSKLSKINKIILAVYIIAWMVAYQVIVGNETYMLNLAVNTVAYGILLALLIRTHEIVREIF